MSSAASESPQVLIVGAGPAGLASALALAKQGIPVRIIDKVTEFASGRRCAVVTPRTMEVLHLLGIAKGVKKVARDPLPVTRYKLPGGIEPLRVWMMAKPEKPTSDRPYVTSLTLGQDQLEQLLRDEMAKYSCSVELGSELVSLSQDNDRVEAVIRRTSETGSTLDILDVSFVVGADGQNGIIRRQLNIPPLGGSREEQFITADTRLEGLKDDTIHMWTIEGPQSVTILAWPGSGNLFTIQIAGNIPADGRLISDEGYLEQYFVQQTNREDVKFLEVLSVSEYRPQVGMLDKLSQGRVFMVGDAAHVHTLTGGLGMNSGIQDSINLSWKLARVIKGQSKASILETYNEERLPIIAEVLNKLPELRLRESGTLARAAESTGLGGAQRSKVTDQMNVHYRWSSIILQESEADTVTSGGSATLIAGDRAPNATKLKGGEGMYTLFDLFSPSRDTVIAFHQPPKVTKKVQALLKKMHQDKPQLISILPRDAEAPSGDHAVDMTLHDTEDHAFTAYEVPSDRPRIFVIRPDGVIGAISDGVQGLVKYYAIL